LSSTRNDQQSTPHTATICHLVEVIIAREAAPLHTTLVNTGVHLGGVVRRWCDPGLCAAVFEWDTVVRYIALVAARGADYLVYFPAALLLRLAPALIGSGPGLAERLMAARIGRNLAGRPIFDAAMLAAMDALRDRYGGIVRREMRALFA
jgi:hypothetical protein